MNQDDIELKPFTAVEKSYGIVVVLNLILSVGVLFYPNWNHGLPINGTYLFLSCGYLVGVCIWGLKKEDANEKLYGWTIPAAIGYPFLYLYLMGWIVY